MSRTRFTLTGKNSGFSLVELIVVVAIFLILSSVIFFNQSKFSSNISISNFTYNIALNVRKAQVYGLLVREQAVGSGFSSGYGIRFEKINGVITMRFFADKNTNNLYDSGESMGFFALAEGNIIKDVCTTRCLGDNSVTYVDISFKRPDPSASIRDSFNTSKRNSAVITTQSALGDKTKQVSVGNTGQISVQ